MPIRINCQCGKALNVRDDLAGKAVKCPGCGKPIRVPAAGAAAKPAAAQAKQPAAAQAKQRAPQAKQPAAPAQRPAAPAATSSNRMDDLFSEEGFSQQVAAVCPACAAEMSASAVLCTKCGYHKETGERFESHKLAGVDIDHGTLALQKAERDMAKAKAQQEEMLGKAEMPWWALGLILFMIVSATSIAVIAINVSRRVDGAGSFNAMATFLMMSGCAFYLVSLGANLVIIVQAFQKDVLTGVLTLLVPFYMLYFVIKYWSETWKFFITAIFCGGAAGGFFAAAVAAGLSAGGGGG